MFDGMTFSKANTGRRKILHIRPEDIFQLLGGWDQGQHAFVSLPRLAGDVPRDAKIDGVWYNPYYKCFAIGLQHESFDEVPNGEQAPSFLGTAQMEAVDLRPYQQAAVGVEALQADAHRYQLLRDLLQLHGCPWPADCHVPLSVGRWLEQQRLHRNAAYAALEAIAKGGESLQGQTPADLAKKALAAPGRPVAEWGMSPLREQVWAAFRRIATNTGLVVKLVNLEEQVLVFADDGTHVGDQYTVHATLPDTPKPSADNREALDRACAGIKEWAAKHTANGPDTLEPPADNPFYAGR